MDDLHRELLAELAEACDELDDLAGRYRTAVQRRTAALRAAREQGVRPAALLRVTGLSRAQVSLLISGCRAPNRPDMRGFGFQPE